MPAERRGRRRAVACALALPLATSIAHAQAPASPTAVRRIPVVWTDSGTTTRTIVWAPVSPAHALPVLIFSPGFGQSPAGYATLAAEWARHGYVVVGVAHPVLSDPDHTELSDFAPVVATQLVRVMNHIARDRSRAGSPFSAVDTARVGAIGHSLGGSAAAQACAWDRRFRACMNLDGTIFGSVVHTGMRQPFFLMRQRVTASHRDPPRFLERHDQGNLHEDSVFAHTPTMYWLTVDHLDHMAFTDAALTPTLGARARELAGLRMSATRAQAMTTRYVLDFFGTYLLGAPRSPALLNSPFPATALKSRVARDE